MRHQFLFFILVLSSISVYGQTETDTLGGVVSYKTSQNVYVKFKSTKDMAIGDTLFVLSQGQMLPAILVTSMSSTSCVGNLLTDQPIEVGAKIIARVKKAPTALEEMITEVQISPDTLQTSTPEKEEIKKPVTEKPDIKGRISAASYINFSDQPGTDKQRMRYTLSFNARRIGNTGLSAEAYMSFRNTLGEWQEVQDNFKRAFKVYSLALEYGLKDGTRFWMGRKINFNISNIGAIDGIQGEKKWKKTLVGAFAGSRPDLTDYGFNPDLKQYGAYVGYVTEGKNGLVQSTFAIAEQRNGGMTDRRFAYFQHINSAIKRVNIFTSFEFDLYKLQNEQPKNTLDLTSIYFSLRYRVSDKLSLFGSYDSRSNIIYYESYKNFIDQLLEEEARQGFRFSFNYHPIKKITIGSSAGYRYQKGSPTPSMNMNNYLTISRVPGIKASATLSAVLIQSSYLNGIIYGIRMSRDIVNGKLFGELEYRWVTYHYNHVEFPLQQSIVGANLSWRFTKTLSFAFNYEAEIQNKKLTNRIYTNLIKRF